MSDNLKIIKKVVYTLLNSKKENELVVSINNRHIYSLTKKNPNDII